MLSNSENLVSILLDGIRNFPSKTALQDSKEKLSYKCLKKSIDKNSNNLLTLGLERGDRVILLIENSVKFIEAYFSIINVGGIVVPVDYKISKMNLLSIIEDSGAKFLYLSSNIIEDHKPFLLSDFSKSSLEFAIITKKIDLSLLNGSELKFHFHDETLISPIEHKLPKFKKNQIASILYTTGSTGKPKGVTLSHANILNTIKNISEFIPYNSQSHELVILPLSHSFGLNHVFSNLKVGGSVSIENGLIRLKSIFKMISEGVSGFPGSPSTYGILLDRYENFFIKAAKQLKFIVINSAPLPTDQAMKIMSSFPKAKLYVYYGLTEASRSTLILHSKKKENLLKSVGQSSPNVKISILDDNNIIKSNNVKGEVIVKGKHIMQGYWNDNKATKNSFIDGWFKTGDLGYLDNKGYLFLEGRKKDMINVDGLKTSSQEINNAFNGMKNIEDFHAFSIKVNEKSLIGEKIVAMVVVSTNSNLSEEDFLQHGRSKLEEYKIPKEYYIVNKIPRSDTGKVLEQKLKQLMNSNNVNLLK